MQVPVCTNPAARRTAGTEHCGATRSTAWSPAGSFELLEGVINPHAPKLQSSHADPWAHSLISSPTCGNAAAAIEDAQEQYGAGDFAGAVKTLEGALKLGGSGVKRDRSKPAELSLGEKQAIFYNLTSAHSKLGAVDRGLEALEALLQAGYCSAQLYGFGKANEDYVRLLRDPDLESVRGDARFKQIVDKYQVTPTELQLQMDPSQSVIGRAMKMWGSKK